MLTVAKFFGLHVAAVMMVQLVLVARLPWLDRRLGMDRLTAWHRWVGFTLVWTIVCHATFVLLGFARLDDATVPETFLSLAGVTASLLGMCAAGDRRRGRAASSTRYARRRLPYEIWHATSTSRSTSRSGSPSSTRRSRAPPSTPPLARRPTGGRCGRWSIGSLLVGRVGRAAPAQRAPPASGWPLSSRSPTTSSRCTSPAATSTSFPARPASSSSGASPATSAGGRRTRSRCPPRPTAGTLRLTAKAVGATSAGLRDLPVGHAGLRRGSVRRLHGAAPDRGRRRCSSPAGSASRRSAPCWRRSPARRSCSTGCAATADAVLLPELRGPRRGARARDLRVLAGRTGEGDPPIPPFEPAPSPPWCPTSRTATSTSAARRP